MHFVCSVHLRCVQPVCCQACGIVCVVMLMPVYASAGVAVKRVCAYVCRTIRACRPVHTCCALCSRCAGPCHGMCVLRGHPVLRPVFLQTLGDARVPCCAHTLPHVRVLCSRTTAASYAHAELVRTRRATHVLGTCIFCGAASYCAMRPCCAARLCYVFAHLICYARV